LTLSINKIEYNRQTDFYTATVINFDNNIVPDLLSSVIFQQFTYTNSQKYCFYRKIVILKFLGNSTRHSVLLYKM